ncbi:MAG: hypothetical protein H0X30_16290 [Anaerolineae bacterium]|nr:hypothetical protein [Anaerolineae bacterium]
MKANLAAAHANCTAVALTEPSAAFVSFQRRQPSLSPTQNVDSAPRSLASAMQFGGNDAVYAVNAVTIAIFTTFRSTSPYP